MRNKLTAISIKALPFGKHSDGAGLMLVRDKSGSRWVYRYSIGGVRRQMGLGSLGAVSLADARKARDTWAAKIKDGYDPISERKKRVAEATAAAPTFEQVARDVLEGRKTKLKGDGKAGRWLSPIENHVFPKLGRRDITKLHQQDIHDTLKPIWRTKHPTAIKAIERIRIIFKSAQLRGMDVDPFTVDAAREMLGAVDHKEQHIPATPWQDIPALYKALEGPDASRLALRWGMLTVTRSDAYRGAMFAEIEGDVWTVPEARVKGMRGKVTDFRVPLSGAAMDVLAVCQANRFNDHLFPSPRKGGISDNALLKQLKRVKEQGRPHGFRTSFRTWTQDNQICSYDVAETILGHTVGGKVERAYARSDLLDVRRPIMEAWGQFILCGDKV